MTRVISAVALLSATFCSAAAAETTREVLDRRRVLEATTCRWVDRHQRMKVTIADRTGKRTRELDVYERRSSANAQKTMVVVRAPADLAGTAVLSFTDDGRSLRQWLFLPAYKQARLISSNARDQRFVGTDLIHRDLELLTEIPAWSEDDAHAFLRGNETIDETPCYVIELAVQHSEMMGYSSIVVWLGRDDLMLRQFELFERRPSLATAIPTKRVRQSAIVPVGGIPVAHDVIVETPAAGSRTRLEITHVEFDRGLEDEFFTTRQLERGVH